MDRGRPRSVEVLALGVYPAQAAATRFRLLQLVEPLRRKGINLRFSSMLDANAFETLYDRGKWRSTTLGLIRGAVRQLAQILRSRRTDIVLVQRQALIAGPPLAEWIAIRRHRCPLVLDLDDPTYLQMTSPTYGTRISLIRPAGKTDALIRRSSLVLCGSPAVAEHAKSLGAETVILPTVVDTEVFAPRSTLDELGAPVIGWVGSHSTYEHVEPLFPVLEALARRHSFSVRVVGSGRTTVPLPAGMVEVVPWTMGSDVANFQALDIGLYPLGNDRWSQGKSGLKAIQYMAVGVPFVCSPVGILAEIGQPGRTHLEATNLQEWEATLEQLLTNPRLRSQMGRAGRSYCLAHYTTAITAERLAGSLKEVLRR